MVNVLTYGGQKIECYTFNTVIVGSGAAGLNAAYSLEQYRVKDVCLLTEGLNMGTSRNTGSDKQTYYKLSLGGDWLDSPRKMAEDLFKGGCVDGDQALVEAALSAKCFFRLCEIGVPFPHNEFGEYVGYQTDFDSLRRATSAGPLTSKLMHEKLLDVVVKGDITVLDGCLAAKILTCDNRVCGLIALRKKVKEGEARYLLVQCENIVYAVGGPAGLYGKSVYPPGQVGASGIAFEAGAVGKNLTEWQYGIASTGFRWNLSGTYQQVLPRYYSTAQDGTDERDFLKDAFPNDEALLSAIFRKGYQWPFCPNHLTDDGSSCIDILVFREISEKNRRVFMDYRSNPAALVNADGRVDVSAAGNEAYAYLSRSNALQETPVERLIGMNRPAYELYKSHGIDLRQEALEVAVCAQHNNGGLQSDSWWESNISGFYPVGEVNGSHGVTRPGGSALNAGQAGSLRAAQSIVLKGRNAPVSQEAFLKQTRDAVTDMLDMCARLIANKGKSSVFEQRKQLQDRMSKFAAHIRSAAGLREALDDAKCQYAQFEEQTVLGSEVEIPFALQNRDLLIAQIVYLSAMLDYCAHGGASRGSYIVGNGDGQMSVMGIRFSLDAGQLNEMVQTTRYEHGKVVCEWRKRRDVPESNEWFETVSNEYRRIWQAELV